MSKAKGYPNHQPFCVAPRRNLTKNRAWWQLGNSNNQRAKGSKSEG